jgi:leucyl-tRNA synthetase
MEYNFREIEAKWLKLWNEKGAYKVSNNSTKPKYYVLDMFPYPSGSGLHVGHPLGYIASDILARFKRLKGFNVLHPMGYDAFGLPAEQYAIETGQHPFVTTKQNIARYREQLDKIGFAFDWSREVRTSDPAFYKWTQWIFLKLFNHYYDGKLNKAMPIENLISAFEKEGFKGDASSEAKPFTKEQWTKFSEKERSDVLFHFRLAYLSEAWVNWCPGLGTVLANDEVKDGVSERGGFAVERKLMPQWSLRMTAYAERLLNDLDKLDWPENIKDAQRNWIGRSEGSSLSFKLDGHNESIEVFTTRPDTVFGVTFVTLAPENQLVQKITPAEKKAEVDAYVNTAKNKSERERQAEVKKVTGVFTGAHVIHPFTNKKIQVWVGDYVLAGYGTGAVMGVPAHDSRDHAFAKHFNLDIPQVVEAPAGWDFSKESHDAKEGKCINSDFLNGLEVKDAIKRAIQEIEKRGLGKGKVNYRLRDAAFGRQRYWGEPIPIYYKDNVPYALPESELPLVLPEIDDFRPTETGDPPLARAKNWKYQGKYDYEFTTMPGWAGSSWYYLRYMDPHNDKAPASPETIKYWGNVDFYIGGAEHVTGHLLYVRFWTKFLFDYGFIPYDEPAQKLVNQGMIQGRSSFAFYKKDGTNYTFYSADKADKNMNTARVSISLVKDDVLDIEGFKKWRQEYADAKFVFDGKFTCSSEVEKMSKSKYNVVNPDDVIEQYGADTLRMYEMFLGPIELSKPWSTQGISGVNGFLRKLWKAFFNEKGELALTNDEPSPAELKVLHKTIKKINEDIERLSLNTSVSAFMICLNELSDLKCNKRKVFEPLLVCLSPFAPYIAEELWSKLGHTDSILDAAFPEFNESYLKESIFAYPVSFNGKTRFTIELSVELTKEQVEKEVLASEAAQKWIQGNPVKKVIVVPRKIVNVVM